MTQSFTGAATATATTMSNNTMSTNMSSPLMARDISAKSTVSRRSSLVHDQTVSRLNRLSIQAPAFAAPDASPKIAGTIRPQPQLLSLITSGKNMQQTFNTPGASQSQIAGDAIAAQHHPAVRRPNRAVSAASRRSSTASNYPMIGVVHRPSMVNSLQITEQSTTLQTDAASAANTEAVSRP